MDGLKGNFEVADQREYVAVATLHAAQPIPQLLFSNLPEIVEQQQFVFDSFWSRAMPCGAPDKGDRGWDCHACLNSFLGLTRTRSKRSLR